MKTFILSSLALALCAAAAHAQIINVQINPSVTGHGGSAPAPYTGQGSDTNATVDSSLSPQPAYFWNQAQGGSQTTTTGPALLDTTGATTAGVTSTAGAAFTLTTPAGEYNSGYYQTGSGLYGAYAFDSNAGGGTNPQQTHTISFSFSGLTNEEGQSFSLYLYGSDAVIALANANSTGSGSTGTITIADGELTLAGVVDGSGNINGTVNINGPLVEDNGLEADFHGAQLDFTPAQTPEPSTWAMMLAGVGALAFGARRRATQV